MTEQTEPACPAEYEWMKEDVTGYWVTNSGRVIEVIFERSPHYFKPLEDWFVSIKLGWLADLRCSAIQQKKPEKTEPTPEPNELTTLRAEVARLSAENQGLKGETDTFKESAIFMLRWVKTLNEENQDLKQRLEGAKQAVKDVLIHVWEAPNYGGVDLEFSEENLKKALALLETNETEKEG